MRDDPKNLVTLTGLFVKRDGDGDIIGMIGTDGRRGLTYYIQKAGGVSPSGRGPEFYLKVDRYADPDKIADKYRDDQNSNVEAPFGVGRSEADYEDER